MSYVLSIPAQVYFLIAFAAGAVLLADTAVRSWRSPERVADPSWMWSRPAPIRAEYVIGPRLPSGSFRLPEVRPPAPVAELHEGGRVPVTIDPVHVGATEAWSPLAEIGTEDTEHEGLPLSLDEDTRVWLAERLAQYDAAIAEIETARRREDGAPALVTEQGRTFDDELSAFQRASFALPAYRRRWVGSIEDTGEINGDSIRRALARV